MALQIILSQVNGHSLCLQTQNIPSLEVLKQTIYQLKGIYTEDQRIIYNGHEVTGNDQFAEAISQVVDFVPLRFSLRAGCCGGKGGFGSLLRSAKSVKKTTNFGSCRDITGRRLRDVENEKRLAEWQAQERERAEGEKKKKKEERKEGDREEGEGGQFRKKKNCQNDILVKEMELSRKRKDTLQNVNTSVEKGLAIRKKQQEEERKRKRNIHDSQISKPLFSDDDSDGEQPLKKKLRKEEEEKSEIHFSQSPTITPLTVTPISPIPPIPTTPTPTTTTTTTTTITTVPTTTISISTSTTSSPPDPHLIAVTTELSGVKRTATETTTDRSPGTIDLSAYHSAFELEALGLDTLKAELMHLGMKCGGNLKQRAERLWSTKDLILEPSAPLATKTTHHSNKKKKT